MKLDQLADTAIALAAGLAPGALGAAVSLAYEKGLTWTERLAQFGVGIVVSYFAGRVVGAIMTLDPFVLQGVTFTLGMIAFKTVPRFSGKVSDLIAELPDALRGVIPGLKKKDGA